MNDRRGLCTSCEHMQTVTSSKGSTFVLCALSATDPRFPKYPRLPVLTCSGYCERSDEAPQPGAH